MRGQEGRPALKLPKPKPEGKAPFWRGVAKQRRARRLGDRAGYKKGWV
jgi:hypothetical protein